MDWTETASRASRRLRKRPIDRVSLAAGIASPCRLGVERECQR